MLQGFFQGRDYWRSREDAVTGAGTKVCCNKLSTGQQRANFSAGKKNKAMPGEKKKKVRFLGK